MSAMIVPATRQSIEHAARLLQDGELVAFPTETVYGLGADASNGEAVRRIFAAKSRPADHPVIVHIPDVSHVERWARVFPEAARKLAAAFWPGALTLILPRTAAVSDLVTGGQDSVGLRVPSHPIARDLLAYFARGGGSGIAAPSANRYGRISATSAQHVADDLGAATALILDGGACEIGIESTIIALTSNDPVLLRPGAVSVDAIARVLGRTLRAPDVLAPRASGTLPSHYAPRTAAATVAAGALLADVEQRTERDEKVAVLARTISAPAGFTGTWIKAPAAATSYAHELYANLRALDAADADYILIENVPDDDSWTAIRDRLARAAHGEQDDMD
jgi:L-threonylcarbamoyladenylate synthase